jgi:ankyrin repeat protein
VIHRLLPTIGRYYTNRVATLVELCIDRGVDVTATNASLRTPLHLAAAKRSSGLRILQALLDAGCPVDAKDKDSCTALHCAANLGWVEAVEVLLKAGADWTVVNRWGQTPVQIALHRRQDVRKLLEEVAEKAKVAADKAKAKAEKAEKAKLRVEARRSSKRAAAQANKENMGNA